MSIVESLATGTPIIGSNIGNVGSLIENGVNGLKFQFDSATDLQKTVESLTNMTNSSLNYYRQNLTQEENYIELSKIYKTILN